MSEEAASAESGAGDSPESLVRLWTAFWNSYDLNQIDALFDKAVTYFSSEKQGLLVGVDAVREHHRGFGFRPGGNPEKQSNKLWLNSTRIDQAGTQGDVVVWTSLWFFLRKGAQFPQRGPLTAIAVKTKTKSKGKGQSAGEGGAEASAEDCGWRVVHMNFSNYAPPKPQDQDEAEAETPAQAAEAEGQAERETESAAAAADADAVPLGAEARAGAVAAEKKE